MGAHLPATQQDTTKVNATPLNRSSSHDELERSRIGVITRSFFLPLDLIVLLFSRGLDLLIITNILDIPLASLG